MIKNWKKAAAVIAALAITATVVPALSSPASAAFLKPGISSGGGVAPAVVSGFPGCSTGTAYQWSGKSPGTQSPQPGVSITLKPSSGSLPGTDSRYVDFQITGAKMVQAIAKTDVFIIGFITESNVYSYASGVTGDTKIHPPTSSNNSPYKVDGYRFCYEAKQADLSISKSASTATVDPGEEITYTLTVANAGPDDATGVTVTDTLPAGVTFVSASDGGTEDDGVVTWTNLPVTGDGPTTLTVVVNVDADALGGTTLTNSATVSGNESDPDPVGNGASTDVSVNSRVDIAVTKTVSDPTPNVGETVDYVITATNVAANANATATGVEITDLLPAEVTQNGTASPSAGTFDGSVWSISSLAEGASATLTIPVTIVGAAGDTISNTAALTAVDQPEPENDTNDSSTASLTINSVDLAVSKSVKDDGVDQGEFVVPGDPITYEVVVTLVAGNIPATGVSVTDVLDAGLSVVSLPSGCAADGQEITCTIADGELNGAGDTTTITYVAKADAETEGDALDNDVSVRGNEADPVPGNNTSSATVNVLELLTCDGVLELVDAGALASVDIRLIGDLDPGTCFPKGVLAGFSDSGDFFVGFDGGNPVATRIDIRKEFASNPGFDLPELQYAQVDPGAEPTPPPAGAFGDLPGCNFRAKAAADGDEFDLLIGTGLFPTLAGVLDIGSSTAGQPATSCEVASSEIPVAAGAGFVFEQTTVVYGEFLDPWFR